MKGLLAQPDKQKHFGASFGAMLVLGAIGIISAGQDPDGFVGIMTLLGAFFAVIGIGLAKETLWDPWLRPKLGLGPKGEPDMDDMKANIGGAGLALLLLIVTGASTAMLGGG